MHIGIAGVGRMGESIGQRLIEKGHTLSVWNRSSGKTATLEKAGASVAQTPAELVRQAEAVITILLDADAIDAVYGGPDGLLSDDVKGKLFIEMSTVLPETQMALAGKVRAKGAAFVECPVSGSVGPARQGQLIGVAGGEQADVERARPVLADLCRRLEHVGDVGAGSTMKLAINLPLMVYWQAFGEALAMCRDLEVDPDRLIEIFNETSGGANVLKRRGSMIAAMLAGRDPGPEGFDIDGGRKDIRTMLAAAKRRGIDLPVLERALASFDEAAAAGWGGRDNTLLPVYWMRRGAK
jgi:3-hydroxyisobutyrate dehydrogenase